MSPVVSTFCLVTWTCCVCVQPQTALPLACWVQAPLTGRDPARRWSASLSCAASVPGSRLAAGVQTRSPQTPSPVGAPSSQSHASFRRPPPDSKPPEGAGRPRSPLPAHRGPPRAGVGPAPASASAVTPPRRCRAERRLLLAAPAQRGGLEVRPCRPGLSLTSVPRYALEPTGDASSALFICFSVV